MSRVGNSSIVLQNVEATISGDRITLTGSLGAITLAVHHLVAVIKENGILRFKSIDESRKSRTMLGTMCALVSNMMQGVTRGFERKLTLVGVGYRVQLQDDKLSLSLGFSHPLVYKMPEGVKAEALSQTEIMIKGIDKQKVGQVAAKIRGYRPPEPYKGKGVRYSDEIVIFKETKKK